jgi:hypothetical protein
MIRWRRWLPGELLDRMGARLSPQGASILAAARQEAEPPAAPADLLASPPGPELAHLWVELLAERGWSRLAGSSLPALLELSLPAATARSLLLAQARWASLEGQGEAALLAGLRALELGPEDEETVIQVVGLVEDRPPTRRILQAFAPRVENDYRFAPAMARIWSAAARPWRAVGPLRRARQARPGDARLAALLGEVLRQTQGEEVARPHLLAAAHLAGLAGGLEAPRPPPPGEDSLGLPGD